MTKSNAYKRGKEREREITHTIRSRVQANYEANNVSTAESAQT